MNLPRRAIDCMVRPLRRRASAFRFPGVTKGDENEADTIWRPRRGGTSGGTTVSTSGSSGKIHQNLAVLHFHGVGRDMKIFIGETGAGAAIEFPGVKGTGKNGAVERTVAERSAGVRADAVDGVQNAIYIT